ncbi:MAG: hypothetical protein Q4C73_04960 [Eubacteriales bacterium]|nr:hypothetical protein [Eubacteriales bacterium]
MKRVICASDIERLAREGKLICMTDEDTIVTPAARDAAASLAVIFSRQEMLPPEADAEKRQESERGGGACGRLE